MTYVHLGEAGFEVWLAMGWVLLHARIMTGMYLHTCMCLGVFETGHHVGGTAHQHPPTAGNILCNADATYTHTYMWVEFYALPK